MLTCFGRLHNLIEIQTTELTITGNTHNDEYEQLQLANPS